MFPVPHCTCTCMCMQTYNVKHDVVDLIYPYYASTIFSGNSPILPEVHSHAHSASYTVFPRIDAAATIYFVAGMGDIHYSSR